MIVVQSLGVGHI